VVHKCPPLHLDECTLYPAIRGPNGTRSRQLAQIQPSQRWPPKPAWCAAMLLVLGSRGLGAAGVTAWPAGASSRLGRTGRTASTRVVRDPQDVGTPHQQTQFGRWQPSGDAPAPACAFPAFAGRGGGHAPDHDPHAGADAVASC
jgi:hypothetical protein